MIRTLFLVLVGLISGLLVFVCAFSKTDTTFPLPKTTADQNIPKLAIYKGDFAFCATTICSTNNPKDILCNCQFLKNSFFVGPLSLPPVKRNQVVSMLLLKPPSTSTLVCNHSKYIDCYTKVCDMINGQPQCHCTIVESTRFITTAKACNPGQTQLPNGMPISGELTSFMINVY